MKATITVKMDADGIIATFDFDLDDKAGVEQFIDIMDHMQA